MNALVTTLRTQQILWAALTFSPMVYVMVGLMAAPSQPPPGSPVILYALAATSVAVAALSFVFPAGMFAKSLKQRVGTDIRIAQVASQSPFLPEEGFRSASPSAGEVQNPAETLLLAARLDQGALILSLALRESIALYGLVLALMGFPLSYAAAFFVVSVALMALRFPSLEGLRRRVEKIVGARVPSR